jgi:UDP-2-acetamido-3-amino-2,3-dideoxy-glucuronate N-acetyltransferase
MSTFIHESAWIDADVQVGDGVRIWHFSHVMSGAVIGAECNIGKYVEIGPGVRLGRGCKIQNNVSLYKGVVLEDFVFCGPSAVFTNIINPRAGYRKMNQLRPTLIKTGATLGANCTVVCGHTIGRYAFVAAGAVVTRDVPDFALVLGNPARHVGWVSRSNDRLNLPLRGEGEAFCPVTGERYVLNGEVLECVEGEGGEEVRGKGEEGRG